MKTSENVYTALVICWAVLLLLAIAEFQLIMIPQTDKPQVVQIFEFICVDLAVLAIAMGTTCVINLKQKKLGTVATIIQIVALSLSTYGFPLAIWGIVLLVKSNKAAKLRD